MLRDLRADLLRFIPVVQNKAHSSVAAQENTAELTDRVIVNKVPGDFVECGVFSGVHCAIMAKGLMLAGEKDRHVHLFDSFQGIPEAGPRDAEWPGIGPRPGVEKSGRLRSTGISVCSRAGVEAHMAQWGIDSRLLVYHEGWFQETLPEIAWRQSEFGVSYFDPAKIALLRLDGDLYESTKVCLEFLYPRVSPGGFVIIDDFLLEGCRAAVEEYFDGELPDHVIEPGGAPMWWQKI